MRKFGIEYACGRGQQGQKCRADAKPDASYVIMPTSARAGFKFKGWYTDAGAKVSASTVIKKSQTLYAYWVEELAY